MELIIDPELREHLTCDNIPQKCLDLFEKDLIENGIRDKIVVWKKKGVIVDGHRRYAIAKKHGLEFDVHQLEFETIQEVKDWIEKNQIERRNVPKEALDEMLANLVKSHVNAGQKASKAIAQVADESDVCTQTVRRAVRKAEAKERLAPEVKQAVKSMPMSDKAAKQLASLPEEHQVEVIEQVRSGEFRTIGEALQGSEDRDDLFREAFKALGLLAKKIDLLKGDNESRYKECRKHISALGESLKGWK